jgi:hypothetical protein
METTRLRRFANPVLFDGASVPPEPPVPNGSFVAVGAPSPNTVTTPRIMHSRDGITWTPATNPDNSNNWRGLAWSEELHLLVAVGINADAETLSIMSSPDAINWTLREDPTLTGEFGVIWAGAPINKFVAVSNAATDNILWSSDGIDWNVLSAPANRNWRSLAWSPELELIVATGITASTDSIMTSPDGLDWTLRNTDTSLGKSGIAWSPELAKFAVSTSVSTIKLTSSNGVAWAEHTVSSSTTTQLAWAKQLNGEDVFVATASATGVDDVAISSDGEDWTVYSSGIEKAKTSITYSEYLSLLVSSSGDSEGTEQMFTSINGTDWIEQTTPLSRNWTKVLWCPNLIIPE